MYLRISLMIVAQFALIGIYWFQSYKFWKRHYGRNKWYLFFLAFAQIALVASLITMPEWQIWQRRANLNWILTLGVLFDIGAMLGYILVLIPFLKDKENHVHSFWQKKFLYFFLRKVWILGAVIILVLSILKTLF